MYSTALPTIHTNHRGHTCMHTLQFAVAIAVRDHWYVCVHVCCGCVVLRLQRAYSWQGAIEIQGEVPRKPGRRACASVRALAHLVLWSRGTSAPVRVTGSERSFGLKSITTATASHNPIPSHPIQELCATWLACPPPGRRGDRSGSVCLLAVSAMALSLWAGSK